MQITFIPTNKTDTESHHLNTDDYADNIHTHLLNTACFNCQSLQQREIYGNQSLLASTKRPKSQEWSWQYRRLHYLQEKHTKN